LSNSRCAVPRSNSAAVAVPSDLTPAKLATPAIGPAVIGLNEYVYEALRAGASGLLLKDVPPEQMAAGIRVVAQGEALLAPSITRRLIQEFAAAAPAALAPPPGLDELTARELEVFRLVARGLSNAEIAAELIVSDTTVQTHVARVLMKLGLRDRVQAVVLAYESGVAIPGRAT
jgi:DNA-binding NarL/FixJ family response regulator